MLVQITVITSTNFAGRLLFAMLKKSGEDGKGLVKKVGSRIAETAFSSQHSAFSQYGLMKKQPDFAVSCPSGNAISKS